MPKLRLVLGAYSRPDDVVRDAAAVVDIDDKLYDELKRLRGVVERGAVYAVEVFNYAPASSKKSEGTKDCAP
jgi:hypothetical protein